MNKKILEALKKVLDPELNVNIVDLGLIYKISEKAGKVAITMTLTTPGCPMAPVFETTIKNAVRGVGGVEDVKVDLTFEPMWDPSKMTSEARLALGF